MQHSDLERLKEILPEAKKKARLAREVMGTEGYKEFKDWTERYSALPSVKFTDLNSVVAFCANAIFAAGVRHAGNHFEDVQKDEKAIQQQIERMEREYLTEKEDLLLDDEE